MEATPRREVVEKYRSGPGKVEISIDGLNENDLEFRPAPDKWSIREIIIHLCDSEIVAAYRIRKLLSEKNANLTSYDQNLWVTHLNYGKRNITIAIELFRLLRKSTAELFEDLTQEAWQRTAIHDQYGIMTLFDLLQLYAEHCENHVAQIRKIRLQISHLSDEKG